MNLKARRAARAAQALPPEVITWTRADPVALAAFDPKSKSCTMNCGKHALDPRSAAERKLLCTDCEPYRPSVHEALCESQAHEAALRIELQQVRAELEQLRAVTRNA